MMEGNGDRKNGFNNNEPSGSKQAAKARYKVTLHVPTNNKTSTIIVPHPQNATILSLREAALARAAKVGFPLPTNCPDPSACLGEIDGGLLCDDDVLEDVIFDPASEGIWFVFTDHNSGDRTPPMSAVGTARSTQVLKPLDICIITPELAKTRNRLEDIPKLPRKFGITYRSTLQQLKDVIGKEYFGVNVVPGGLSGSHEHGDCNCLLARKLLRSGTRDHVSFVREGNGGTLTCDICSRQLSEPCPQCASANDEDDDDSDDDESGRMTVRCGTYLKHVGCQHVFHQHCSEGVEKEQSCPVKKKPHTTRPLSREYVPVTGTNRFLIVVYGRSSIAKVPLPPLPLAESSSSAETQGISFADVKSVLSNALGKQFDFTNKVAHIFGAITISHTNQDSQLIFEYSCVVSICSHTKHPVSPGTSTSVPQITLYEHDPTATTDVIQDSQSGAPGANSNPQWQLGTPEMQYDIDIHTADAPIVCLDDHTELGDLHLDDCAVGSVINLFVTLRSIDKTRKLSRPSTDDSEITGMDEMFMDRDHWRLQVIQSERGMATFLSSTRVFASKIEKADPHIQNSVLALFMHLTHFPPILRSLHTLMTKKTLTPAESAVLVQCVYELTRELLTPGHLIENKKERVLEGSRLFYHLAMELSNKFQNDPAATEYLDAMKPVNLVDAETFQPLKDPVTTNLGIIESAYFRALTEGLLGGLAPVTSTSPNEAELRVLKLVKRTGGTMTAVTVFDSDTLQLALHDRSQNPTNILDNPRSATTTKGPRELNYNLQDLCQQSAVGTFAVVRPMSLRSQSVQVPTLSLDSEGLMAVYLGRPPCAPPDKDITIFRPTRGGAVDIDVSLVTQLLEPILKQRTEDRSVALDSLGEAETKVNKSPSEIIMLCVDGSTSMKSTAGFEGLNNDAESDTDDSDMDDDACDSDSGEDEDTGEDSRQKALSILSAHENLQDIVSTIRTKTFNGQKEDVATRALAVVISLYKVELEVFKAARLQQEANLTTRHLQSAAYRRGNPTVQRIKRLQSYLKCLNSVAVSDLVPFLLTQASRPTGSLQTSRANLNQVDEHQGSGVSGSTSATSLTSTAESTRLEIPPTFQCPISYELFETPVVAEDGFTYDKTHIERWFQTTGTNNSPMTGLRMGTLLLPNRNLSTQIREWREGLDIIRAETQDNTPSRQVSRRGRGWPPSWRSSSLEMVKITMIMDTSHWDFRLPKKVRYDSLRALAYRCLKGETTSFTILHNGESLLQENGFHGTSSTWTVTLKFGMTITIHKGSLPSGPASASPAVIRNTPPPEKVLVKVYRYSGSGHTAPTFTFWILKNTQRNVGSILFNYWTHNLGSLQTSPDRFKVWANTRYLGDGQITAHPLRIWQPLSEVIRQYMTEGTTESDALYQRAVEDGLSDRSSPVSDEKKANVLKLLLVEQSNIRKRPKPSSAGKVLTRMDVMKQVFDNYINRTLAYDISNHIGLITFATKPALKQNITGVIENLRNALGNLQCEGDTAMWDALKLAAECLKTYGAKYPEAKKRIVCLSDGEDTNSKVESWRLCMDLQNDNIVVDSISIGMAHGGGGALRGISYGTGGYKFFPRDLESAVAICELETVLSQAERPEIPTPNQLLRLNRNPISEFRQYAARAVVDIVNEDVYPARKSHPNLQDEFIAISSALEKGGNRAVRHNATVAGFRLGDARLLQEMRLIASNNQPYYDVYASESNMRFWKVVMEAPPDSTYAGGVYLLYLDIDTSYPRLPPKARFVTPILHPNINKHGRVCHSILDRDWTSDTTLSALLNVVWSLLLVPNKNDFANVVMSLNYLWDEVGHQDRVRAHVQKHATKTRQQWRQEITGRE